MKRKRRHRRLGLIGGLVAGWLFLGVALAAGEIIPRNLMESSGGWVSNGSLRLHHAVGQPVAGTVSNGNLTLCSGLVCGSGVAAQESTFQIYLPLIVKSN